MKGNQTTFSLAVHGDTQALWVLVWLTPAFGNCSRPRLPAISCQTSDWPTVVLCMCWSLCSVSAVVITNVAFVDMAVICLSQGNDTKDRTAFISIA